MVDKNFGNIRSDPTSATQSKRMFSNDRIKTLVKQQIQKYIESFFRGQHRPLLKSVSPKSLSYNTDRSFDPDLDPTQKRMQIVRYFNHLKNILPAMIIADSGVQGVPHSIGYLSDANLCGPEWSGIYPIVRKVNINIVIASMDVDSTDELSDLTSLMFNELRNLAGGHFIHGDMNNGESWVITLPNAPIDLGGRQEATINDDPLDRIHYVETSFQIMFEDKVQVKKVAQYDAQFVSVTGDPDLRQTLKPIVSLEDMNGDAVSNDEISINQQVCVKIEHYNPNFRVYVSNANLATINQVGVITPRRLGELDIIVDDSTKPSNKRVLTRKTIKIV